jgi:RNA polymerase sigma-70 factor (ECF subfamily)
VSDVNEVFATQRPRLVGIAYRITGSWHDADDVAQEAWLRLARQERAPEVPEAWLTTVTTRLAIDRARQRTRERDRYVGPWLPEPTALAETDEGAVLADSLTLAFLVVLDQLGPLERAAFVLRDVFATPYDEIASTLARSESACRQLVHRARAHLREQAPHEDRPFTADDLTALVNALVAGDRAELLGLLSPTVTLVSDGGPHRHAARRTVVGPFRVARLLANLSRREPGAAVEVSAVNGAACLFIRADGGPIVLTGTTRYGKIACITVLLNPDKVEGAITPRLIR